MRIAIVGMGVAGSYIAGRLGGTHEVVGFDRFSERNFDSICAWGTSKGVLRAFMKNVGLNFEDYVLHDGKRMIVETHSGPLEIKLKDLCTYDKARLIKDLLKDQEVHFGQMVLQPPEGFDLVVDSTALRGLLPKVREDLYIPCLEYMIEYGNAPFDDFYIKPFSNFGGYFWYFPLGDGRAYVGAGDYFRRHVEFLEQFRRKHGGEAVKRFGRPIRIAPPSLCQPFSEGNVVGVGESIGTVFPVLGEGIIPSLQCAELFIESLHDLELYKKRVLEKFKIYETIFRLVRSKMQQRFRWSSQFINLLRMFYHMRTNEDRYGLQVRLTDMLKLFQAF